MSNASLASVPNIGDKAPDFELPDPDMKPRKLNEFYGKKTILAFFPAAESPVCTAEMCALRDSLDQLRDLGANVVGISVDGPFEQVLCAEPASELSSTFRLQARRHQEIRHRHAEPWFAQGLQRCQEVGLYP